MIELAEFLRLIEKKELGPSPGFSREHSLLAFMLLAKSKAVGRQTLAAGAGVGEGSIRTILKKLRQAGLAEVKPAGIQLTEGGLRAHRAILKTLTFPVTLQGSTLSVGQWQAGILVRSAAKSVTTGIQQRDASIRLHAEGATSYVYRGNRFAVPGGSSDCEKDFPSVTWTALRAELRPRDGDAIIVCGAKEETTAKLGAISAALTLV
ncbi:MAG: hypothetical protein JRM99_03090 [Nitrososphaerota archaeon]|nr:hypothetical protein [Nitrososphaerota archaeon]